MTPRAARRWSAALLAGCALALWATTAAAEAPLRNGFRLESGRIDVAEIRAGGPPRDGIPALGHFRGNFHGTRVFTIARNYDRIEFAAENTAFHFDKKSPLKRAAEANITRAVLSSQHCWRCWWLFSPPAVPLRPRRTTPHSMLMASPSLTRTSRGNQAKKPGRIPVTVRKTPPALPGKRAGNA